MKSNAFQQHPDFQGAETAGQFRAVIPTGECFIRSLPDDTRVFGVVGKGGTRFLRLAVDRAADVDWKVKPLVRIERDGVGLLDPGK